jgi:hypothetical protein
VPDGKGFNQNKLAQDAGAQSSAAILRQLGFGALFK